MTTAEHVHSGERLETSHAYSTAPRHEDQQGQSSVVTVPIRSLRAADSPRLSGENEEHARALAESETALPPIIVNRSTMRVIDGMHRLSAAALRGEHEIQAQLFDGDEDDAFVLAVKMNIAHGLPLSLADRTAAAVRIIRSRPQWSDRAIASTTGLAAKTVGVIRRRSTEAQLSSRLGRDGRVRPLDIAQARRLARQLMVEKPNASLREIAGATGISLGTAQNVRKRLHRDESPTLPKQPDRDQRKNQPKQDRAARHAKKTASQTTVDERALILRNLQLDPSFRFTDSGRVLLRLLHALTIDSQGWARLIDDVPARCAPMVSDAARACADTWQELAEQLEQY